MEPNPLAPVNPGDESEPTKESNSSWWVASILSLVGSFVTGVIHAATLPNRPGTWDGVARIVFVAYWTMGGALLCVIFATVSLVKRERRRLWTTLPVLLSLALLVPILGKSVQRFVGRFDYRLSNAHSAECRAQIRQDPEIAVRERWYQSRDVAQFSAFDDALLDPKVRFTTAQLEQAYAGAPAMRSKIFRNPYCTPEFLAAHFKEACEQAFNDPQEALVSLVRHPNTPIELIEQVAQSTKLPGSAVESAKQVLRARAQH